MREMDQNYDTHRQGSKLPCYLILSTIYNSGEPARCIIKFHGNGVERLIEVNSFQISISAKRLAL
jgi:hypothetical protein